ncbi:MAG: 5-(carboxyamino)imidazole ribonucleotide synthase, partial [Janthinobacterium sp.]
MRVAVLGTGQLGTMLQQAGQRIGIDVRLLDVDSGQLPETDVRITAEREHWPVNQFTDALQGHPGWLNGAALALLSNRIRQKSLLDQLGLPTAPWCVLDAGMTQAALHQELGPDLFLKRATGGYDGRGQQRVRADCASVFAAWADNAVAEQAICFDTEVSIIGARGHDGQIVCYRLTENRHDNGVLTISLNRDGQFEHLQHRAEHMLQRVMQHLDYVGVMAIECFIVGDELLINEIAPRVHNSGHWTQAGASISQFELHLRAVCGLPLPQPEQNGCSMMINLLGLSYDTAWIRHGAAQLH